jgi:Spy/CpxP family protein refolding chaperone
MKHSPKHLVAILAGTLLIGTTGAVLASGDYHNRERCGHHGGSMHGLKRLDNLSDEQRDQIKAIMREQRDAMRDRRDEMRDSRRALRDAMQQGADEATLRPLAEKQGAMVTEMIMERAKVRNNINAVLTEEQRKQLEQQRRERRYDDDDEYDDDDDRRGHGYRW